MPARMVRPRRGNTRSKDGPAPAILEAPVRSLAGPKQDQDTTGGWPVGPDTRPSVAAPTRLAPHRRYFPIPRSAEAEPSGWLGLRPGEPETARRDLRKFLPIWGHLALLLAVMKVYHVEGRALFLLT